MPIAAISAILTTIIADTTLTEAHHVARRAIAIEALEYDVLDRIALLIDQGYHPAELLHIQQTAQHYKQILEACDAALFGQLRAILRQHAHPQALINAWMAEYLGRDAERFALDQRGYDDLDLFFNQLLLTLPLPEESKPRAAEMIFYQQTPIRIILELIRQAQFSAEDVFYDIGSGLGHVPLLVNLFSGIATIGIEYEPSYCAYAQARAAELNRSAVRYITSDARYANYAGGTVFFLYTPCVGRMLDDVVWRIAATAQQRQIRVFSYGPCTTQLAQHDWLEHQGEVHPYRLASFVASGSGILDQ